MLGGRACAFPTCRPLLRKRRREVPVLQNTLVPCVPACLQVMLAQQETVAQLLQLLEEARAAAAAMLRPLTRAASPMKLRALRSEQEADSRVKHDRWGRALWGECMGCMVECTCTCTCHVCKGGRRQQG